MQFLIFDKVYHDLMKIDSSKVFHSSPLEFKFCIPWTLNVQTQLVSQLSWFLSFISANIQVILHHTKFLQLAQKYPNRSAEVHPVDFS